MLKIYNTFLGKKQPFRPIKSGQVGIYVCGVTVYDRCHLGHARSAIVFDVIRRYLEHKGYLVRYVKNFTDVDDKIINRANEEDSSWKAVAETNIRLYQEDMNRLRVRAADVEPRATDYIGSMVTTVERLVKKGYAYPVDGNVFYRVKRFKPYGRLSKRKTEDLQSGARIEIDERKDDPLDFALWKASKPGEPSWPSSWGPGRPGWHIECSVMAMEILGETFDIHGGGKDLIFPHHENEIAQSEADTQKRFARYWMHNGFVTMNHEKMSKSLGNFFTVEEIFKKSPWPEPMTAEGIRYLLMSTHYRSPIDWSDAAFEAAKAGLDNFYDLFLRLNEQTSGRGPSDPQARKALQQFVARFKKAMDDDFNTALAIGEFQRLRASANQWVEKGISENTAGQISSIFRTYGNILGLFQLSPESWKIKSMVSELSEQKVNGLVMEREEARKKRDWSRADAIRKELSDAGVILEDRPDGSVRIKK